jgi:hypothetical protein
MSIASRSGRREGERESRLGPRGWTRGPTIRQATVEVNTMKNAKIVSRAEWLQSRRALMTKEKELTRFRDQLAAERRALPWVRID